MRMMPSCTSMRVPFGQTSTSLATKSVSGRSEPTASEMVCDFEVLKFWQSFRTGEIRDDTREDPKDQMEIWNFIQKN